MPDNKIIIRPGEVDLRISGQRIEDFPNTGTYIAVEKISPMSVHTEAQKGTSTSTRMAGRSYRVTVTVMQFSPADRYMMRGLLLLQESNFVLSIVLNAQGMKYVSGQADAETMPTRELAADSAPMVSYAYVGSFQTVIPGFFIAPEVATAAQINNFGT